MDAHQTDWFLHSNSLASSSHMTCSSPSIKNCPPLSHCYILHSFYSNDICHVVSTNALQISMTIIFLSPMIPDKLDIHYYIKWFFNFSVIELFLLFSIFFQLLWHFLFYALLTKFYFFVNVLESQLENLVPIILKIYFLFKIYISINKWKLKIQHLS